MGKTWASLGFGMAVGLVHGAASPATSQGPGGVLRLAAVASAAPHLLPAPRPQPSIPLLPSPGSGANVAPPPQPPAAAGAPSAAPAPSKPSEYVGSGDGTGDRVGAPADAGDAGAAHDRARTEGSFTRPEAGRASAPDAAVKSAERKPVTGAPARAGGSNRSSASGATSWPAGEALPPEPSDSPYKIPERATLGSAAAKPKLPAAKASKPSKPGNKVGTGRGEPVRRAIAGAPTESEAAHGAESPELALLRAADLELFAPASPPIGTPWPSDLPAPMPIDPGHPVVHASGLPPARPLTESPPADPPRDLGWLRTLSMPDLPVRWDPKVLRYLDYYRSDQRGRSLAQAWLKKSGRYGTAMRRLLREPGLPEDLLWVSLVESGFDPAIRSPAGAAGLWQLMPEGARIYGLAIDRWIDERLDPERSTEAAARYLADLHRRFGGWELALAAYNMGYGGLLAAIRKYNTNDYWELCRFESGVPFETAVYVPKIIAMSVVARNFAAFGLDSVKIDPPITSDDVAVPGAVSLRTIAQAAGVDLATIEGLNPQLRAGRTPPDGATPGRVTWSVRVPAGKGAAVTRAVSRNNAPSDVRRYQTRLGDSFDLIAQRQHVSRARLAELNAIRSDEVVRPGTVLLLPLPTGGDLEEASASSDDKPPVVVPQTRFNLPARRHLFYRAVTGDSLSEIARAFSVTADELCRWNALDPGARLHEGMILQMFVPKDAELARVVYLGEDDVHRMDVGSEEFFAYFEGLRGRKRTTIEVQQGDTWEKIGKRYKLTLGQLERINRRWHTDKLSPGETLVVYAPLGHTVSHEASIAPDGPSELPPMVAPSPEDLPSLTETLVDPQLPLRTGREARLR